MKKVYTKWIKYSKINIVRRMIMNKKVQKILVWAMIILMIGSVVSSILMYALS